MNHANHSSGCQFAYQIERLYWKATACRTCNNGWRDEFGRLESEIRQHLSQPERAKLLRSSRAYQRLQQFAI
ncbi:hypothetical protein [Motiliproteus sediminis]|uniref:hypothetical protein n=1 Tax=Motiliproteus sediminis TaxID=1468178 RepID=UPI001AEFC784|nr:hypothetical protein [Motiliproteus sediminis]